MSVWLGESADVECLDLCGIMAERVGEGGIKRVAG